MVVLGVFFVVYLIYGFVFFKFIWIRMCLLFFKLKKLNVKLLIEKVLNCFLL